MIKGVLVGLSLVLNTAVEPYQPQSIPKPDPSTAGVRLMLAPAQGPVGTQAVLKG